MRIATLVAGCILSLPILVAAASDYVLVGQVKSRHNAGSLEQTAQRLLYAEYDDSGNTQNLMEVDVAKGSVSAVLQGLRQPAIIAETDQYLVFQTLATYGNQLQVVDKAKGTVVARKYLLAEITWGHIDGNRLLLLQPRNQEGLIFRLPDLKLTRKSTAVGTGGMQLWGKKIVSLGLGLIIYDMAWRELSHVDLPAPKDRINPDTGCAPRGLKLVGEKAIVGVGCRQLAVVDLAMGKVERTLSLVGHVSSFDITDGLALIADGDGEQTWISVIDLATGEELQQLDISGSLAAVRGERMVVSRHDFAGPMELLFYDLKLAAIKSAQLRSARLISVCGAAGDALEKDGDLHAAIAACERAGARAWLGAAPIPASLAPVAVQYGRWLSHTLSRYEDGKAVLLKVESQGAALAEAESKIQRMNWPPPSDRLPQPASKSPFVFAAPIDYGSFPDQIYFSGERVYVARWRCNGGQHDGVTLEVLDRHTLSLMKRIPVVACDGTQQDAIQSVDIQSEAIVLGLTYRFPERDRPNFALVDKEKLEVTKYGYAEPREASKIPDAIPGVQLKAWDRITAIPESETIFWSSIDDPRVHIRFARYDLRTKQKKKLFELRLSGRPASQAVWRQFAFVMLGQDLFVYDLKAERLLYFERDPLRAGLDTNHNIERLIVDRDRLVALSYDGTHSFMIDLPAYIASILAHQAR